MKDLTVPGTLESLDCVSKFVLNAAQNAQLDHATAYRLRLAVDEIATNIIMYGYANEEGELALSTILGDSELTIYMEDTGTSYDPSESLPPDHIHGPVEERRPGGLGVYLALWGVDQFHYKRTPTCNRSIFTVKRA